MAELDVAEAPVEPTIPSESPAELAAARTKRATFHKDSPNPANIVDVGSDEAFETLAPGRSFKGPDGKTRVKPYTVTDDASFDQVPEGSQFIDPEGKLRQKSKYEGIDFTAQTLYDMALTDKEKRKALERSYPGKVKEQNGELYIEDGKTLRKPGRGFNAATGFAASAAAPTTGAVLGAVGGGAAGSAVPGAGNVAGAVAGGFSGGVLGQAFNDIVLQLAGVYDRTKSEEAGNLASAGLMSSMGVGVGRGVATVIPSIKAGVSAAGAAAPRLAANFLGASKEDLGQALQLADKGVQVPPSAWAHEAPHLQNLVEVFDPAFRTNKPLAESAAAHYEKSAGKILEDMGVKPEGSIIEPKAAVPTQAAGEKIMQRTLQESFEADANLQKVLAQRKAAIAGVDVEKPSFVHEPITDPKEAAALSQTKNEGFCYNCAARAALKHDLDYVIGSTEGPEGKRIYHAWAQTKDGRYVYDGTFDKWFDRDLYYKATSAQEHLRKPAAEFSSVERIDIMNDAASGREMRDLRAGVPGPKYMGLPEESGQAPKLNVAALPKTKQQVREDLLSQQGALVKAADDSRKAAQALIDQGFKDIQRDVDDALKVAKVGGNTGELWEQIGAKFQAIKRGIQERHSVWYEQADAAAGGHLPNVEGLSVTAREFLEQMPEGFESRYPAIVKKMRDLAGVVNEKGEIVKETVDPTFGQLHNLRSDLRNNVNWYEIAPDMKDGVYKFFSKRVDEILHDANAVPELKLAARLLDATDKSYGESMSIFKDNAIRSVIKGLESGEPADPKILFNSVVKEGRTDLTKKVKEMVGPNLWSGVRAADVQEMLDASKSLVPGQIDARTFAKQVLDRHRANMLEVVHGKEASEGLLKQAQYIAALDGKVPISALPGDTMTSIIGRARLDAEAAKKAAQQDPLKMLGSEMKKIEADTARSASKMKAERRNDPLGFLYEPTTGASEAVNKILGSEDLILAAATKFGEKSPEFEMLRQIYVQRFLQGTMQPAAKLEKVSPQIQQIMFPGVTESQMKTLAKEMEFLLNTRAAHSQGAGSSMSAFAKVENPVVNVPGLRGITKLIPGVNPGARAARGAYYALVTKIMTSPALLRWIEKGLTESKESRDVIRNAVSKVLQKGGAVGAGIGEAEFQAQ